MHISWNHFSSSEVYAVREMKILGRLILLQEQTCSCSSYSNSDCGPNSDLKENSYPDWMLGKDMDSTN